MIGASVERQLEGETRVDWRPEGLHCSLTVPRSDHIQPMLRHDGGDRWTGDDPPHFRCTLKAGNRVLLVEDEIPVAMMMRDILSELGFSVLGPFSRRRKPWWRPCMTDRCRHHRYQSRRRARLSRRGRALCA